MLPQGPEIRLGAALDGQDRALPDAHEGKPGPGELAVFVSGAEVVLDIAASGAQDPVLHGLRAIKGEEPAPVVPEDRAVGKFYDGAADGQPGGDSLLMGADVQGHDPVLLQVEKCDPVHERVDVAHLRVQRVHAGEVQIAGKVIELQQDAVGLLAVRDAF